MFDEIVTEHQLNSNALVPIGGQLPYYQELRKSKLLDFLQTLFKEADRREVRRKLDRWLYARSRPGFYVEIFADLHLAYSDQRDGHGSQHWWRLFFTEKWKSKIESILNSTALTVSNQSRQNTNETNTNNKSGNNLIEWGGMFFRSKTEVKIAETLYNNNVLFFANAKGQISRQGSPATEASGLLPGRVEVDFLVFHQGKCLILEVDGQHHNEGSQTTRDYVRDRTLLREGIATVRFTADECYNRPNDVVTEFLNMF